MSSYRIYLFLALIISFQACTSKCKTNQKTKDMQTEEQYTFSLKENVERQKIKFKNRYGITLVADLYLPKNRELSKKYPAVVVSGPFGAVKEQSSGLYAQELASRGMITMAFDPSYTGESGGEPRYVASPDINTEDFCAAVDFFSTREDVNPAAIGILGICGWGGFALNAAAQDTRIKATVTSTMYDMTRVSAKGYNDSVSAEDLYKMREELNNQRTIDAKTGKPVFVPTNQDELKGDEPQFIKDYHEYYKT